MSDEHLNSPQGVRPQSVQPPPPSLAPSIPASWGGCRQLPVGWSWTSTGQPFWSVVRRQPVGGASQIDGHMPDRRDPPTGKQLQLGWPIGQQSLLPQPMNREPSSTSTATENAAARHRLPTDRAAPPY